MKILVFTEGTIIREEKDVKGRMVGGWKIAEAPKKLATWQAQGAQIVYLTSRRRELEIEAVRRVLSQNGFPGGELFYRREREEYKDVAERLMPDMIVEDDCEGIGGEVQMTYPHIRPDLKSRIKSVVVKEFGGIDHLPDSLTELIRY